MVVGTFRNVHKLNLENIRTNLAKQEKKPQNILVEFLLIQENVESQRNYFKIQTHKPSIGDSITVYFCKGI